MIKQDILHIIVPLEQQLRMLQLLPLLYRRDILQLLKILIYILIMLLYNHLSAVLDLIRPLNLQLLGYRPFYLSFVQWLRSDIFL